MREYYIRREGDEDASGPFDIDQISSLIEANKLDANAYYYDIETESWLLISSNEELMETLFPKKRKLTLRTEESEAEKQRLAEEQAAKEAAEAKAKMEAAAEDGSATTESETPKSEEQSESETPAEDPKAEAKAKDDKSKKPAAKEEQRPEKLEVTAMLALAEGRASDPKGKSPKEKKAAVAFFGLRLLTLIFGVSVLAMAFIEKDLILTADAIKMAKSPYLIVALFDLAVVITLLLQVTEVYPLLRFRAAIGAGLLTLLFYSSGDTLLLVSNLLLMLAIYFASAILKQRYLIVCALVATLGIAGYGIALFSS